MSEASMPTLLRFVRVAGAPFAAGSILGSLAFVGAALAAPGPFTVRGEAVSREAFLALAMPLLGVFAALGVLALVVAWGLRRERRWARPLLFVLACGMGACSVAAGALGGMSAGELTRAGLGAALLVGALGFYLWRLERVVAWFDALPGH